MPASKPRKQPKPNVDDLYLAVENVIRQINKGLERAGFSSATLQGTGATPDDNDVFLGHLIIERARVELAIALSSSWSGEDLAGTEKKEQQ
jgi:hypothetical protein